MSPIAARRRGAAVEERLAGGRSWPDRDPIVALCVSSLRRSRWICCELGLRRGMPLSCSMRPPRRDRSSMYSLRVPEAAHTRPKSVQSARTSGSSVYSTASQHVSLALSPRSLELPVPRSGPHSPRLSSLLVRCGTIVAANGGRASNLAERPDLVRGARRRAHRARRLMQQCLHASRRHRTRGPGRHRRHSVSDPDRSDRLPARGQYCPVVRDLSWTCLTPTTRTTVLCDVRDPACYQADSAAPAPYRPPGGTKPLQKQRGMVASKLEDDGRFRPPHRVAPERRGGCAACCVGCLACALNTALPLTVAGAAAVRSALRATTAAADDLCVSDSVAHACRRHCFHAPIVISLWLDPRDSRQRAIRLGQCSAVLCCSFTCAAMQQEMSYPEPAGPPPGSAQQDPRQAAAYEVRLQEECRSLTA